MNKAKVIKKLFWLMQKHNCELYVDQSGGMILRCLGGTNQIKIGNWLDKHTTQSGIEVDDIKNTIREIS